ncbi:MAG: amino acid permease [Verrucomicrobiales bacterium]|nr:amino acid permease [Verrucomicrobiales bacterium]
MDISATPQPAADAAAGRPPRTLGLGSATALVVASMLGTGIFTTSGFLLADLQSPWVVLGAWVVGGLIALLGALSYGALACQLPESGGEYLFLSRTLHPAAGYIAGWVSLLVGFSAPLAAAANAFGQYTGEWFPASSPVLTGTVLLVVVSLLHAWNVKGGAVVQNLAVVIKVVLIALFLGLGFAQIPAASSVPPAQAGTFTVPALAMSMVWISFSYAGWNAVVYLGGEVKHPERNIPRSLILGTVLVTVLYVAINAVFLWAVPGDVISGQLEVGRLVAQRLGGKSWAEGATILVSLALMTSVSSLLMSGPRVYARIAADGYLPAWMQQRSGPPRFAIAFQLVLALLMLWTATYQSLLSFIGFTLGLSTAATVSGLVMERLRRGPSVTVPGWPWVPLVFVVAVLGLTLLSISRAPLPSLAGFAVLGLGWLRWRLGGEARELRRIDAPQCPPGPG